MCDAGWDHLLYILSIFATLTGVIVFIGLVMKAGWSTIIELTICVSISAGVLVFGASTIDAYKLCERLKTTSAF